MWLQCTPEEAGSRFRINLADLPDVESWMHLTYSASYKASSGGYDALSESYVRIDISSFSIEARGEYGRITEQYAYYGMGNKDQLANEYGTGFAGSYRQFYMSLGDIEPENVPLLMHEYKVLDFSTMAYYKFESTILLDRYDDSFRNQRAFAPIEKPVFSVENIAAPFCNSIPQKYEYVPKFYNSAGNTYSNINIPKFKYKGRNIGYTMSFWMINFGQHSFSTNPYQGRT